MSNRSLSNFKREVFPCGFLYLKTQIHMKYIAPAHCRLVPTSPRAIPCFRRPHKDTTPKSPSHQSFPPFTPSFSQAPRGNLSPLALPHQPFQSAPTIPIRQPFPPAPERRPRRSSRRAPPPAEMCNSPTPLGLGVGWRGVFCSAGGPRPVFRGFSGGRENKKHGAAFGWGLVGVLLGFRVVA